MRCAMRYACFYGCGGLRDPVDGKGDGTGDLMTGYRGLDGLFEGCNIMFVLRIGAQLWRRLPGGNSPLDDTPPPTAMK